MKYPTIRAIDLPNRQWPSRVLKQSPRWCAVDLRDGNQALPNPMTPEQKLEYFDLLVEIGFKEIEIGFPSASRDEFDFCRTLIEENRIPDDVTINVLTQAREHLVTKTLEALQGAKSAVVHFYIASSELHYSHVIGLKREDLLESVRKTTRQIREGREAFGSGQLGLEFSPEEFTDTDLGLSIELCNLVLEEWDPPEGQKVIYNLPATVERRPPNQYADMIEIFCSKINSREKVCVSLHAHNDQGCAVAATELALLAGADRVEGTLFGHGERTGNVDLVTVALNLSSRNIDTGLDFKALPKITEVVARITQLTPHARHPYAGELVFTAFSGSHQDAIGKCLAKREEVGEAFECEWKIPYLHVDPETIGRSFEKFIRINSQSGKGGVAFVMRQEFGIKMPKQLLQHFMTRVQTYADDKQKELDPSELKSLFDRTYLDVDGRYKLVKYFPRPNETNPKHIHGELQIEVNGEVKTFSGEGNGPVSAFVEALRPDVDFDFKVEDFQELSLNKGADASALAYVAVQTDKGVYHGIGLDTNIDQAAVKAFVAALNAAGRA